MQLKVFLAGGLAIALAACGGGSPTTPAPPTAAAPAVPPRLTGVVQDDSGVPVAGATVTAAVGTSAETDALGQFHVTTTAPEGVYFGLQVYKSGYDYRQTYVRGPTVVIRLGPTRVQAGESRRITVGPGDSVGPAGDIEYLYRTIRIFSPTPTHLEVRVVADDGGPVDWRFNGSPCCPPPGSITGSIEDTGAELGVEVRIPFWLQVSRTFTVVTRTF